MPIAGYKVVVEHVDVEVTPINLHWSAPLVDGRDVIMLHHIDIAELERLQQRLQRLRMQRAQVVHQQKELLRQHGSKQQV